MMKIHGVMKANIHIACTQILSCFVYFNNFANSYNNVN